MPIDRALWKRSLSKNLAPAWPCPSCRDGKMRVKRETLHYEETAESRQKHYNEDFHEMEVVFAFSAILECTLCKEPVACGGDGGYAPDQYQDEDGYFVVDYKEEFYPKFFSQPMKIFSPPTKCPKSVKRSIEKSFNVFFCDPGAASNHVRQSAEEILTNAGIAPTDAKGKFVPLGTRIASFKAIDKDNADRVDALRWIGNFGSHPENITMNDVFNAYDILEVLLEGLYVWHQKLVRNLVDKINTTKRPS